MGLIGGKRHDATDWAMQARWETLVIDPFESEKEYYSHTTVFVGLPEGQNCDLLVPRPICVIDCRTATIESVTDVFRNLKEYEHYILLDDILALPKNDYLRQLLYHCVKESVFRADRMIILIFRYEDGLKNKLWSQKELKDLLCDEFPCIHISEDRKGDKDIFYGNYYNRTFVPDDWRFRSKGPQKTDDYFGVKPPKKDPIINKKGRELGSRASIFRSIATQLS